MERIQPIKPVSKVIYDKAKSLGIETISLLFSGGNDEGILHVKINGPSMELHSHDFIKEIEEWAWSAYSYNGVGDGSRYGDEVTYNLEDGTVTSSHWHISRIEDGSEFNNMVQYMY